MFSRKTECFLLFIVMMLVLSAYSNSIYAPFTLDDLHSFVKEPLVLNFTFSWEGLCGLAKTKFGLYRFLPMLSFALDLQWGSGSLMAFHISNIIIHLLAILALFFLLNSLFKFISYDTRPSVTDLRSVSPIIIIVTVGFWALNPVQTNAVTYLVQRMTSMAALFYFLALGCYLRGRAEHLRESFNKKVTVWYLLSFLSAACSFLCKENSATLPVVILLIEFLFVCHGSLSKFLRKHKVLCFLAMLCLPIIYYKLTGFANGYGGRHFTCSERLLTELRIVSSYIFLLLLPLPHFLNMEHDPVLSTSLFNPVTTFTSLLFLLIIVVYAWRIRKRYPLVTFAVYWFFINLLIESSVVPLELEFEHRLYLPSVGFYLIFALLVVKGALLLLPVISDERNFRVLTVSLIIIAMSGLSLLTFKRNLVWQDTVSLYRDCVQKSPAKPRAHSNLAQALCSHGKYEEAISECEKSIALGVPGYEEYWVAAANLVASFSQMGDYKSAVDRGEALLTEYPEKAKKNSFPIFLHNLGNAYFKKNDYQKACDMYLSGLHLLSSSKINDRSWYQANLGRLMNDLGFVVKFCLDNDISLNIDGLTVAGEESSFYEKMAEICLKLNELKFAAEYCELCVKEKGELLAGCSYVKKRIDEMNSLNRIQRQKGTINTKYFHHPFAGIFNFYMAVAYALEKAGMSDSFWVDYCLRSAAELRPDNADVILLRSWLYYKKSQFHDAVREVDKVIGLDNEYAQLWINRGLYCAAAGRNEDALSAFTKAKALYPDNPKNSKINYMINDVEVKMSLNSQEGDHE